MARGASAEFLFGDQGPTFYKDGRVVTSVICGDTVTFDVPGISASGDATRVVWLEQYKVDLQGGESNTTKTFDGPFLIPMPSYQTVCGEDEGIIQNYVYEAVKSGDTYRLAGSVIGSNIFAIGSRGEIRSSFFEDFNDGIVSLSVSRGDPSVASGYFYADSVVEDFIKEYGDDMDSLVVVPTDSLKSIVQNNVLCDCAWVWRQVVTGLGNQFVTPILPYEGGGRFFHVAQVPYINEWMQGRQLLGDALWATAHEIGHGWSAYYGDEYGMLDELKYHWSQNFNKKNQSLMGRAPTEIVDRGNGLFDLVFGLLPERIFNDWDLYNMGLISANQVQSSFVVANPQKLTDTRLRGERRDIDIGMVINTFGSRNPLRGFTRLNTSTDLRVTFLIVQGPTGTSAELVTARNKVKEFSRELTEHWGMVTKDLSSLTVFAPPRKLTTQAPYSSLSLLFKNIFVSSAAAAAQDVDPTLKDVVDDLSIVLPRLHDDGMSNNLSTASNVSFDGDEKLLIAQNAAPDVSDAPMTIRSLASTPAPSPNITVAPRQLLVDRLRQILARLTALQTELLDLLLRRQQL